MSDKRKLLAIVGMPGSGKSSTADLLKKNKFVVLRFGDQTDIGLKKMGMALTEKNEKMYREKIRKELGMAAMAIKIKPKIEKALAKNQKIVLDGLYSWEEYLYLKKFYRSLFLLCLYARPDIRYKRLNKRKVRPLNKKDSLQRDIAEIEKLNKGGPIAIAGYLIINDGSLKELSGNLNQFLNFFSGK